MHILSVRHTLEAEHNSSTYELFALGKLTPEQRAAVQELTDESPPPPLEIPLRGRPEYFARLDRSAAHAGLRHHGQRELRLVGRLSLPATRLPTRPPHGAPSGRDCQTGAGSLTSPATSEPVGGLVA